MSQERVEPPWEELDDGIRETVRELWDAGFDPCDSGDGSKAGKMEGALAVPHVFMRVDPSRMVLEALALKSFAAGAADRFTEPSDGPRIQAIFIPERGVAILEFYGALRQETYR